MRPPYRHPRAALITAAMLLPILRAEGQSATQATAAQGTATKAPVAAQLAAQHEGAHDFDFLIGNWKAHLKRLPDRLVGSNQWIEYDGISNHKKLLDSNANFEEFDVKSAQEGLRIKAQTLRLYNPESHQWSIYGIDVDKGTLGLPPVVGQFNGRTGEFLDQEEWKGRAILVRYQWTDVSPKAAHFEQSFSADGGKTWEANWILDLTR